MDLTVFGIQRSGTNFLEQCIRKNIQDARIKNQWRVDGYWKHTYDFQHKPKYDAKSKGYGECGGQEMYDKLIDTRHRIIYIHKHPYNWIQSICNKNVDILKTQSDMQNKNKIFPKSDQFFMFDRIDILRAAWFWTKHVSWWYELRDIIIDKHGADKSYFVAYESLIKDDQQTLWHVKRIADRMGLPYRNKDIIPVSVGQSDTFTESSRTRYLQIELSGFHWNHISEINKYLDKNLMKRLGYKLIETEKEFNNHKVSPV